MGLFGKKAEAVGNAAEKIGDAFDKNFTSKEERMELSNQDSANARDMQKEALNQEDNFSKRAVYYLAFYWSFMAGLYIFLVSFIEIPENNQRLVDTITGFLLGTIIAAIINFFFGSSYGSKLKTTETGNMIQRILNKK